MSSQIGNQRTKTPAEFAAEQYAALKQQLEVIKPTIVASWPRQARTTIDRFERACLMVYHQADERLKQAPVSKVIVCIQQLSQLALLPDKHFGQASIVCYGGDPQLIIGYRGMVELIYRSGEIRDISTRAIHEGDYFDLDMGVNPTFDFKPLLKDRRSRPLLGVVAVCRLRTGGSVVDWLDRSEIDATREASRAKNGPWATHFNEMAKKTAVRRIFKMLPMDIETQELVAMADSTEFDFDEPRNLPRRDSLQAKSVGVDPLKDWTTREKEQDARIAGVAPAALSGPCDPRESAAMDAEMAEGGEG